MNYPPAAADEINRRFDLHRPADVLAASRCHTVRQAIKAVADLVVANTPAGREQAAALTHLEQALFFALAAIVRPAPAASRPEP